MRGLGENSQLLNEAREEAIENISSEAFSHLRIKYLRKPYHNPGHTKDVVEDIMLLADDSGLSEREKHLLRLAALAHDVDQEKDSHSPEYQGENEAIAAQWLKEKMGQYPVEFLENEGVQCGNMILATRAGYRKPTAEEIAAGEAPGGRVRQSAPFGNDPSYLPAQLLCDADLANFGKPFEIYWKNLVNYYNERNPDGGSLEAWRNLLTIQVPILRNHRYYTEAARQRFNQLEINAQRIEALLEDEEQLRMIFEQIRPH